MDRATDISTALARGVVLILFATTCYQFGFNAGYTDGESHNVGRWNANARESAQVFPPFQWSPARPPPASTAFGEYEPLARDADDATAAANQPDARCPVD